MKTRERPILFSGAMVRAILDGKKTQTRRVYKPAKGYPCQDGEVTPTGADVWTDWGPCPYGVPGDRLWVRESFQPLFADGCDHGDERIDYKTGAGYRVSYPATDGVVEWHHEDDGVVTRVTPSIYMPRWACRLVLEVTDIRVERLQDISEEDARAEGASFHDGGGVGHSGWRHDLKDVHADARSSFARLWDSINAKRGYGWDANPWVWVVSFRLLDDVAQRGVA